MRAGQKHLLVGLVTGLLGWLAGLLPVGQLAELKLYDLLLSASTPDRAPEDIVIVAIDEPSFAELGLQWPWPRRVHARLTQMLAEQGAAVIAFDVVFAEASNPEDDRLFAEAIRDAGNVVLAAMRERIDDPRMAGTMLIEPFDDFAAHAASGLVNVPLDRDFVVRRYPAPADGRDSFAAAIARRAGGNPADLPDGAWIAYRGPTGTFQTVSCYQALAADALLPAGFFENKIVLIGRTITTSPEASQRAADLFATPFIFSGRGALMSGVEIHANMLAGILGRRVVVPASAASVALAALGLGVLASFLQRRWRPWRSAGIACALLVVGGVSGYLLLARGGFWMSPLPLLFAAVVPYGGFALEAYFVSERKRREIRRAFAHYLSPSILEEVLRDPDALRPGGHSATVTLLFSDLAGFTTLSEKAAPAQVTRFLNRYFTEMTKIVFAHRGTVDKFVGDALVAFWGAPVADEDHALNACRAALAMQERMDSLREEMRAEGLPELRVRIGLNSGEAIVGNMGSTELFNYTAIGDAVNLASRLESANKQFGTSILVSARVVEAAGGRLRTRPLGPLSVRGREEPVEVHELLGTEEPQPG